MLIVDDHVNLVEAAVAALATIPPEIDEDRDHGRDAGGAPSSDCAPKARRIVNV